MSDLLPCPFCGGKADIRLNKNSDSIWVECQSCLVATDGFQDSETPEHLLRDYAAKEWNRRASPSQVAPQPQASEAQQPTAFIQKEVLDVLMKDKTATGSVSSGLLRKPFGNPVPLYASPQPANPAQVTDEQIVEIAVAHSNYKDGGEFEVFSHKRIVEFARHLMALTAAIGADTSSEEALDALASIYPGDPDGSIRAAIGAGGQAVVDARGDITEGSRVVCTDYGTVQSIDEDGNAEVLWDISGCIGDIDLDRLRPALSQPHPADERVVEALPEGTLAVHGKDVVIAYDDFKDARRAFSILENMLGAAPSEQGGDRG